MGSRTEIVFTMNKAGIFLTITGTTIFGFVIYNAIQRRRINPPIFYRKSLNKNFNAETIPPFGIYIKESEKDNQALLDHEIVHWKQYQRMGLIKYYREYFRLLRKVGYDAHPMEIEARDNESEYAKNNYTDAVRRGLAVTVYNPDFRNP